MKYNFSVSVQCPLRVDDVEFIVEVSTVGTRHYDEDGQYFDFDQTLITDIVSVVSTGDMDDVDVDELIDKVEDGDFSDWASNSDWDSFEQSVVDALNHP